MRTREIYYFHLSIAIYPTNSLEMKARAEKLAYEKNEEFLHKFKPVEIQHLPESKRSRRLDVIAILIWMWVLLEIVLVCIKLFVGR